MQIASVFSVHFLWLEWSALLVTTDCEQLYISVAQSPDDDEARCAPQEGRESPRKKKKYIYILIGNQILYTPPSPPLISIDFLDFCLSPLHSLS